jgi:hypothetical protein
MLSQPADRLLTESLLCSLNRGITIQVMAVRQICVWLPGSQTFDKPDGIGETVSEALEDAAHRVQVRNIERGGATA